MIDIVCPEYGAKKLLQQVIVLIGGFSTAIDRHCPRPIPLVDFHQTVGGIIQRFIPTDFIPLGAVECLAALPGFLRCFTYQRRGYTILVIDEVVTETPLDAQIPVIDNRIEGGRNAIDKIILNV